jgi:hypothetical protein
MTNFLPRAVSPAAAEVGGAATTKPCEPSGWVQARVPIEDTVYSARELLRLGAEFGKLAATTDSS